MENYRFSAQNIFAPDPFAARQLSCIVQPPPQQTTGNPFFGLSELSFQSMHEPLLGGLCSNRNRLTSNLLAETSKTSICEVNLDDVPMELATSEEDSESEYAEVFLSAYNDSGIQNRSTELDEIELRSRALRSMLLQKKSIPVSQTESKLETPPTHNSFGIKGDHSETKLSCNSSTSVQKQKFVIRVHDSSDSDDSFDHSTGAVFKRSKVNQFPTPPTIVNIPNQSSKISRFHQEEKLLLQRKMELLRLKLTVKRQHHLIDERRKIVRKLSTTLSELRKRTKHTALLYKEANKSLLRAQRTNVAYQRKLASAQKLYSDVLNSVNRSTADVIKTGFALSSVNLRRDLITLSLDVLQRTKIVTWFLAHYRFDLIPLKCNIESVKPSPTVDKMLNSLNDFDPFRPVCPFFLDGECLDKTCIFQHLKNPKLVQNTKMKDFSSASKSEGVDCVMQSNQEKKGKYDDFYCELCKEDLVILSSDSRQSLALQRWHAAYLAYLRSESRSLSLLGKLSLAEESIHPDICAHVVFGLLLCPNQDSVLVKQRIFECLKSSDFPMDACKLVLRDPHLSIPTRRSVIQLTIEYMIIQLRQDPTSQKPSIESSFIYFVYHSCLLEQEVGLQDKVPVMLEDILQSLPKESKLIFVLWRFRLYHQLSGFLPAEDMLSTISTPYISKSVLLSNQEIIETAACETGISGNFSEVMCSFSDSSHSMIFTSFLSVTHLYIQILHANSRYKIAAELALVASLGSHLMDDLFFPSAVHSLFCLDSSLDWTTLVAQVPDNLRSSIKLAHRIEFGFLITCLNWRKKSPNPLESHLIECLGNLIFLPKDDTDSVISAYEDLLNMKSGDIRLQNPELCPRSSTYLWLSYSLYNIIHCLDYRIAMDQLVMHYKSCINSWGEEVENHAFIHHLALMIMFLASHVHQRDDSTYPSVIKLLFLDNPLKLDPQLLPAYFLELIQHVNLGLLPHGVRHDICVQFVETYGARLVPSLCRTLCALGDHFLAQSLCAIGCLEKPDDEDFWLLYASITFNSISPTRSSEQLSALLEILSNATSVVTSSLRLWKHYALAVRIAKVSVEHITNRAKSVGMYDLISCSLKEDNPTKFLTELGLLFDENRDKSN